MKRAALPLGLCGCNQVFGLAETVPVQDRGMVTGVYRLHWAENDVSGAPAVREGVYGVDEAPRTSSSTMTRRATSRSAQTARSRFRPRARARRTR